LTGIVLFQSIQAATRAESVLRREGIPVRLVPVPRHLSAGCSTALSFEDQNGLAEQVEARLREAEVPFVAIHLLEGCRAGEGGLQPRSGRPGEGRKGGG